MNLIHGIFLVVKQFDQLNKKRRACIMRSSLVIGCLLIWFVHAAQAQLKAAVIKTDITPSDSQYLLGYQERKSTGVRDPIYHKILALDDGNTQFFIISSDICLYSPSEYDKVAAQLNKRFGINPLNVWWSVTHTHSAPEFGETGLYGVYMGDRIQHTVDSAYTEMIEQKLIDGVAEARSKLADATLSVGWGFSQANMNRRAIDVDGKASLGMNPDGPVDRRIGLLRIDKADGTPMALIANYAMHGTVMSGANLKISGDAPGIVAEYVEEKTGAPMLFINGAAGNLAPIYSVYPNAGAGHLGEFRVLLGDKILEANSKIKYPVEEVKLVPDEIVIETPRKPGLGWTDDLSKYAEIKKTGDTLVRLPVRLLKINKDIAIWSAPLELFCEVSNEVRSRSPFAYTFYFGYTNGWFGYMPTEAEWKHGGYEVEVVSPFTPQAAGDLTESVVDHLQGKMRAPEVVTEKPKRKNK
ncbi:MAG: neutral/alkaline non-lysosomal ceramidase N-terminal domain-containing protein [Chitinophagaceae bacterium]|nr:neutral/alkaline non-lysosomal ceramidase N-terminal domain-containing protein [Chitinophagaceae bacterium]MCW5929239.1 neutral/alkaline non-lysosomal ceramidase N-terminal domain-containing protein [Chitinophagaceae bacterium]